MVNREMRLAGAEILSTWKNYEVGFVTDEDVAEEMYVAMESLRDKPHTDPVGCGDKP